MGVKVREKVKGSGVFWIFVNHNNRRTSRLVGSEKAANETKEKIEARLKLGAWVPEEKETAPTIKEYWEKQFEAGYLKSAVAKSTAARYKTAFNARILPALGSKRLDEVTATDMEIFVADLVDNKKLARDTVETTLRCLCRLYNRAKKHGKVDVNPASGLSELYQQAPVRHGEIDPLNHEEIPVFLDAVRTHATRCYTLFLCAIHTGLRAGELSGLQWIDIDFNGKFITARRSIDRVHRIVTPTKSKRVRRVDLSDELADALRQHRKAQLEEWLKRKKKDEAEAGPETARKDSSPPEWVFANQHGSWFDAANLREREFARCLEKAGLHGRRLHDLRHTYASILLTNGAPISYVSEQMGHRSIELTVKRYGHLIPGKNRHFVNALPGGKIVVPAAQQA